MTGKTEDVDGIHAETRYVYDPFGNLAKVYDAEHNPVDANVPAVTYGYDSFNRQVVETDSDADQSYQSVDSEAYAAGRLRTVTRLRDETYVMREYDKLGRLVKVMSNASDDWSDPNRTQQTFTYDALSRMRLCVDYNGVYASPAAYSCAVRFAYDKFNRTLSEQQGHVQDGSYAFVNDKEVSASYAADANTLGYTRSVSYPSLSQFNVDHDARGLVGNVRGASSMFTMAYDDQGRLVQAVYANGMVLDANYDALGREAWRRYRNDSNTVTYFQATTACDRAGNIASETLRYGWTGRDGNTLKTYTYDKLNRLDQIVPGGDSYADGWNVGEQWEHDKVGNWGVHRVDRDLNGSYTDAGDSNEARAVDANTAENEYIQIGVSNQMAYDARGNMIWLASKEYVYDWANRLIEVKKRNGSSFQQQEAYRYDALNRRVWQL